MVERLVLDAVLLVLETDRNPRRLHEGVQVCVSIEGNPIPEEPNIALS